MCLGLTAWAVCVRAQGWVGVHKPKNERKMWVFFFNNKKEVTLRGP